MYYLNPGSKHLIIIFYNAHDQILLSTIIERIMGTLGVCVDWETKN